MDDLPPNPESNPFSDDAEHPQDEPPGPHPRSPLIPAGRLPQFGCGCTLWILLLFLFSFPLMGFFIQYHWFNQLWGFLSIPIFGVIATIWFLATRKLRWFGIGLLVGLLFYCLAFAFFLGLLLEI